MNLHLDSRKKPIFNKSLKLISVRSGYFPLLFFFLTRSREKTSALLEILVRFR